MIVDMLAYKHKQKPLQNKRKNEVSDMKKTTNINAVIKEIKEYQAMQDELKKQIEELKAEAIEYLSENELQEFLCDDGKITYREVISKRFASTEFKKLHKDLYEAFTKATSSNQDNFQQAEEQYNA